MPGVFINEDFEAGGATWPTYFYGFGTQRGAAVGVGGGGGVESYGSDFQRINGWMQIIKTFNDRSADITLDSNAIYCTNSASSSGGTPLVNFRSGFASAAAVVFGVGSDRSQISIASAAAPIVSAAGVNPTPYDGSYRRYRIRFTMSSLTETSPGVWTANLDGSVYVYLNDTLIHGAAGLHLANQGVGATWGGADDNRFTGIYSYPQGYLDNVLIVERGVGAIEGSAVFGVNTKVSGTRSVAFGLDGETNVLDEDGKLKVFGDFEATGIVTVPDASFEYDKIQQVSAASKLLGRGSASGAGAVEEVTVGSGLSMAGTTLSATASAPTNADYLVKTANGSLSAERVVTDNTSITFDWATAGVVKASRAALTGDVTANANANATTIANDAVTYGKMQNVSAASRLLGRGSASGSGDPEEITLGTNLTITGTTLSAAGSSGGTSGVVGAVAIGSEPGSADTGAAVLYTDAPYLARYSGSAWQPWGPIYPFTKPIDADFAWVNQGTASVASHGDVFLRSPVVGGINLRVRKKAAPSTPYTITIAIMPTMSTTGTCHMGFVWRNAASGKLIIAALTSGLGMFVAGYNTPTAYNGSYVSTQIAVPSPLFIRSTDNGTNRICSFSADGVEFVTLTTHVRTDFTTVDEVGFFVNNEGSTEAGMSLLSWKQT